MSHPLFELAVVMERRALANPWQSVEWKPVELLTGPQGGPVRLLSENGDCARWLHPGFRVAFYADEAEGYFLNLSAPQAFIFVVWRMEGEQAAPHYLTASYNEASRLLDAGENVEGLPMPEEIRIAASVFMLKHYRPAAQRARPPSFQGARRGE